MDLKMEVYSQGLELLGIVEEFQSVIWEDKGFEAGSFSIEAPLSKTTKALLVEENVIRIEGDTAGIIEHKEERAEKEGQYIAVKGRLLTGLLNRRILWGQYALTGTPPYIMRYLVNDCAVNPTRGDDTTARKIPNLVIDTSSDISGTSIMFQKTGGYLLDALTPISRAYSVAFGVRLNAEIPRIEFWTRTGVDRSVHQSINAPVFYSTELDDVLNSEYAYDSSEYRNCALVAGEGEGSERTLIAVNGADIGTGLNRREMYVDARDIQSETQNGTLTEAEYIAALQTRGLEKLADNQLVRSFDTTVRVLRPTYEYGADFFLGDKITVTDDRLGVSVDAVVEGARRSVSKSGESLELMFGFGQPTIYDKLKRKADA